jgi:hypothetical protein
MTSKQLQQWLFNHGRSIAVDGQAGPVTRAAIILTFTNLKATAVTDSDIAGYALRLGCTTKQIRAVASVESGGAGFDTKGRPKILFERHLFHRLTEGAYSIATFSNSNGGGYAEDSWEKLTQAACKDADAAFSSASWGKFQVLGSHWYALGYASPIDMAFTAVSGEAAHYEMLVRYVEKNGLRDATQSLSVAPSDCRAFARGYNGLQYEKFDYHIKLARAMR